MIKKHKLFLIIVLLLCLYLIYFLIKSPVTENVKNYNVVLITIDSLRADHLPCYGYERDTAPNICALANDGVLFKNAFSQGTDTPVSLSSLILSKFPPSHGVYTFDDELPSGQLTIFEILENNNYSTRVYMGHPSFNEILQKDNITVQQNPSIFTVINDTKDMKIPFFIWLHTTKVHYHCNLSEDSSKAIYSQNFSINMTHLYEIMCMSDLRFKENLSDEEIKYLIDSYDDRIIEIDTYIGELFKKLKEKGIYNESLIIITADHGDAFGEHDYMFHGGTPYDELIHVPFIIKFPNNKYSGNVVKKIVRHVDIIPTILNVLNLENVENKMGVQGVSLIPVVEGRELNLTSYAYGQVGTIVALRNEKYKFILNKLRNISELYDLTEDPKEQNNLALKKPELAIEYKNNIFDFENSLKKVKAEKVNITEEIREKLRQLGYLY